MTDDLKASAREGTPGARPPAAVRGGGVRRPAALAAWAILLAAAGGCGPSRLAVIPNEWAFADQVLKADRPVVVEFAKGGCVWCMFLDSNMDDLIDEYQGRVTFARFELISGWGRVLSQTIWRKYRIAYYPTAVLFVGGKEKHRWVVDYNADHYRQVLDAVAGPPAPPRASPGG